MALLICKVCHSKDEIWRDRRIDQVKEIDGVVYMARVDGKTCGHCGHERIPANVKNRLDRAFIRALAEQGRPGNEGLIAMREFLALNQRKLAIMLGISYRTVVRWELGSNPIKRTTWWVMTRIVLEELEGKDEMVTRLKSLAQPSPAKKVELTL